MYVSATKRHTQWCQKFNFVTLRQLLYGITDITCLLLIRLGVANTDASRVIVMYLNAIIKIYANWPADTERDVYHILNIIYN